MIFFLTYRKYSVARTTQALKVSYFVKENFHSEYQGSLRRLEISIEEEFVSNLRQTCAREKSYSMYICFIYLFQYIIFFINATMMLININSL